jgi:ATP-dependent exoDNAse (exonuclease V) alpha subunit
VQLTAPNRDLQVANRDLGTLKSFESDGRLTLRMDSGRDVSFDPKSMRHFDHGYAVTSHSSQGLTSQRVLVNMDTEVHPELINGRFAYVSVSRASHDAQVFTNDAATLAASLSKDVSKTSALDFDRHKATIPGLEDKQSQLGTKISEIGLGLAL